MDNEQVDKQMRKFQIRVNAMHKINLVWQDGITDSMDVSLSEFREMVMDREAWRAVIHGVAKSRTRLRD